MSFFAELKRRNVLRAAAFYAASAWLLVQVATQVFPLFHVAEWMLRWIVIAAIIGFPFAMGFSWFYEWTPHGIQRESSIAPDESFTRQTGRKLDRWIIAILGVAVVLLLANTFVLHKDTRIGNARVAPDKSIAVLPFDNRSGDRSQDYFADGLTDELTTTLARISALKVIARASAARYKGTNKRASLIGRELGVATLLTGAVLRAGGRVRYTAELVSASTETTLWADSYERGERDIFALQSEVASAIAKAIAVRLSRDETSRLASSRPVDPKAFDEYLRGRSLWNQRSEPAVRAALIHFQNATRIAPAFALGFAGLADSHIILGVYGYEAPRDAFPAAKAAAMHAIELDSTAGEPHASLGDIHFHYDWDWAGSEREHQRAIALAPGFATAYHWGSEALLLTGDIEGALARLRRARALDPLSMTIRASLAQTLVINGRRDEALTELREALVLDPDFPGTRRELARELLAVGRRDEALVEARKLVAANPGYLPGLATLGLCLGAVGHSGEARALLARIEEQHGGHFVSALELARITAGLEDRDATLQYLRQAVTAREGFLPFLVDYEEFDFLHDDPRFVAIVREIGIPPARIAATRTAPTTRP